MVRKVLLMCGVLASLLYLGADIAATLRYEGYNYAAQGVSELMAIEAPTRGLIVALFIPYNLLMAALGFGVWLSAGGRRALKIAAILLVIYGAFGLIGLIYFPMHTRGYSATVTLTDTMHIIATVVTVLLMFAFIGFGGAALGKGFRLYSIVTIGLLVVGGGIGGWMGAALANGEPTPLLGIFERINIYAMLLWVALFAIELIRLPLPNKAPLAPKPPNLQSPLIAN